MSYYVLKKVYIIKSNTIILDEYDTNTTGSHVWKIRC